VYFTDFAQRREGQQVVCKLLGGNKIGLELIFVFAAAKRVEKWLEQASNMLPVSQSKTGRCEAFLLNLNAVANHP
jgi:hypothetical protein